MHSIDRTLQEFEAGPALNGEFEGEYEGEYQGEYQGEFEAQDEYGNEMGQEFSGEFELSAGQHEQLLGELFEVSNEQELNAFVGSLISKATGAASKLMQSPAGQSVGRYLVDVGKNTLPQLGAKLGGQAGQALGTRAGGAIGGKFGAADRGAQYGGAAGQALGTRAGQWVATKAGNWVANNAKKVFGLELEALSPEQQELEFGRAYVRFASDVARRAERALRQNPYISPGMLGRRVLNASAPYYAPGLLNGPLPRLSGYARRADSGTWVRRGGAVVLYGL